VLCAYGVNADKTASWAKNFTKKHSKLYHHYLLDYEEPWAAISQLIVSKINRALDQQTSMRAANHLLVLRRMLWDFLGPRGYGDQSLY
jgi:hypothetical protein